MTISLVQMAIFRWLLVWTSNIEDRRRQPDEGLDEENTPYLGVECVIDSQVRPLLFNFQINSHNKLSSNCSRSAITIRHVPRQPIQVSQFRYPSSLICRYLQPYTTLPSHISQFNIIGYMNTSHMLKPFTSIWNPQKTVARCGR
jgi:hypothetical protein